MRDESKNLLSNITFLRVSLDNKLKFDQHIKSTYMEISKSIGILNKLQYFVPKSCKLTIYYSCIYPYPQYCTPVWGSTSNNHIKILYHATKRSYSYNLLIVNIHIPFIYKICFICTKTSIL